MGYPTIQDWEVLEGTKIYGKIYNHKDIDDGQYVTIHRIAHVFVGTISSIAVSETNNIYILGVKSSARIVEH